MECISTLHQLWKGIHSSCCSVLVFFLFNTSFSHLEFVPSLDVKCISNVICVCVCSQVYNQLSRRYLLRSQPVPSNLRWHLFTAHPHMDLSLAVNFLLYSSFSSTINKTKLLLLFIFWTDLAAREGYRACIPCSPRPES